MPTPIHIATFGDCRRHGYGITIYCPNCQHSHALDLATFGREDEPYTNRRWRCGACGGVGSMIFSSLSHTKEFRDLAS